MKRFMMVAMVVLVVSVFFGSALVMAEDVKVSGFTKVVCNDEGDGKAPCGSSALRLEIESGIFFTEVETVSSARKGVNWLRELVFSHKEKRSELSIGRLFVGGAYSSPSPRSETAFGPRVPVTFYGWGLRFRKTDEENRQVTVDITGETDGLDGFRTGGFDDPEISMRLVYPLETGQIAGSFQASEDFFRPSIDYKYVLGSDISVRGTLYYDIERDASDKFGGYAFFGKEVVSHFELHAQADYQDDEVAGSSAIWTLGLRLFNDEGLSFTADREIFSERTDRTLIRFMQLF